MINNPSDSVCDYLAELLYEDVATSAPVLQTESTSSVSKPFDTAPQAAQPKAQASPRVPKSELQAFSDAPSFDKAKLAKLLSTTPIKLATDIVAEPKQQVKTPSPKTVEKKPPQSLVLETSQPEADVIPEREPEPEALKEIAWCENGRPSWAQERFDVLLFKVHGLTLAVPLIALGQIQPITDELTPIFGQAKWFMGLQPTPIGQIKTVNTALFVMPERYDPAFLASAKYVISIHGLSWGLAVDSVQQPKTLDPDDVKWRQGRGLRPWLAGTVKEHMCALIDVPNMGILLAASDRNTKKPKV